MKQLLRRALHPQKYNVQEGQKMLRHFYECTDVKIFWHISNQDTTVLQKWVKKTKNNRMY
jgi:dipeptide/tripeptide permease